MNPPLFRDREFDDAPARIWLLQMLCTYLAYAVAGRVALALAIPPGYAAPLYPAAGIALACVLTFGWRMLLPVALAAFHVNLTLSADRGNLDIWAWVTPAVVGVGAALQALIGAVLIKRFVRQPLSLSEPRDIARFYALGAVAACLVSSSISAIFLTGRGTVSSGELPFTWWTWWVGDTLGVLIGAPIALTPKVMRIAYHSIHSAHPSEKSCAASSMMVGAPSRPGSVPSRTRTLPRTLHQFHTTMKRGQRSVRCSSVATRWEASTKPSHPTASTSMSCTRPRPSDGAAPATGGAVPVRRSARITGTQTAIDQKLRMTAMRSPPASRIPSARPRASMSAAISPPATEPARVLIRPTAIAVRSPAGP
ncbi:MAG: MASE1 domain-containing protein [Rhodospirillales bacterium]|nr:MASE1 domain-containing protein [Rhodospirillales bacterium]